jgi:threonine/homoserine/homoserine lactone efflux protein
MATGAFSSYLPPGNPALIVAAALGFALIALPCFALWASFGSALRGLLAQAWRRRAFNIGMALLLLVSLLPLLVTHK